MPTAEVTIELTSEIVNTNLVYFKKIVVRPTGYPERYIQYETVSPADPLAILRDIYNMKQ